MTDPNAADERLERLTLARTRIIDKLDDVSTPAYSIAPLSNQLRLIENSIEKLLAVDDSADVGLPLTPDDVGFVDLLAYDRRDVERPHPRRRRLSTAWAIRYDAILAEWRAAGFVLPDRNYRDVVGPEGFRAAVEVWVDECRAELARVLAEAKP